MTAQRCWSGSDPSAALAFAGSANARPVHVTLSARRAPQIPGHAAAPGRRHAAFSEKQLRDTLIANGIQP